jgi:hypothetical protein
MLLTQDEITQAKTYAKGDWAILRHDVETQVTTWVKRDGTKLHFRETQPVAPIIEQNKKLAGEWRGWNTKPHGSVVASVPNVVYNQWKRECGFDGVQYDKKAMAKKLNDPDNQHFRTGGGRV